MNLDSLLRNPQEPAICHQNVYATVYTSVYSKISTEVLYSRNTSFIKIIKDVTYKMTQSY